LELGHPGLLDDDLLARRRVGERARLLRGRLRPVRLRDRLRLARCGTAALACAIASAWRISAGLRAAALSASASCSRSVASRSASACAMRASLATRAASGAPMFAM